MSLPHPCALGGLLLALLPSCSRRLEASLDPLVGQWTTADPLYGGRSFEITGANTLLIGVGEGEVQRCPILTVEADALGSDRTLYTLVYRDVHGLRDTFEVEYSSTRGTLRMPNRPGIHWSRQDAP